MDLCYWLWDCDFTICNLIENPDTSDNLCLPVFNFPVWQVCSFIFLFFSHKTFRSLPVRSNQSDHSPLTSLTFCYILETLKTALCEGDRIVHLTPTIMSQWKSCLHSNVFDVNMNMWKREKWMQIEKGGSHTGVERLGERGGCVHGRKAAQRRHICHSINFLFCGTWVSMLAAGARLEPSWSSDGRTKLPQKTAHTEPVLCSWQWEMTLEPLPLKYIHLIAQYLCTPVYSLCHSCCIHTSGLLHVHKEQKFLQPKQSSSLG